MKILVLLPILCIGISLKVYSGNHKTILNNFADPIANAGPNQTVYLTENSTATLDGSKSSGESFKWTEISTDYKSGSVITNATSKIASISNLPQGVFYFEIAVTTGGTIKRDSMVIFVDAMPPPKNSTLKLRLPLNNSRFKTQINLRTDTTTYWPGQPSGPLRDSMYKYYMPDGIPVSEGPGVYVLRMERDRSNGMFIDKLNGKLYTTIEDGYGGENGGVTGKYYSRSQLTYGSSYRFDTLKTYVEDWKVYFPQDIRSAFIAGAPNWSRVALKGMHGNDDGTGSNTISISKDSIVYWGQSVSTSNGEFSLGNSNDWVNKTHTLRMIFREGSQYSGQQAFMRIYLDGQQVYFSNNKKIGKTLMEDYDKLTGLYDWRNWITDPDSLGRGKKFSLVTMNSDIWEMAVRPYVDAGLDQTLSGSSTTLSGYANDDGVSGNGKIISYKWTKIDGGAVSISSPNSANTNLSGLTAGTYEFQLKATDDSGIDGYDTVKITVEGKANISPIAKAGADTTVILPDNSLTISGTGTDSDGTIASYSWAKLSGPASYLIVSPSKFTTEIGNLEAGVYAFQLTVKDNTGSEGKDTVIVTVLQPTPPIANVGSDREIQLPKNSIVLPGSGSSVDGKIESYFWQQISGPAKSRITGADSAYAGAWDLIAGSYQFQLTVKDNYGLTGSKILNVLVNPSSNVSPISNAGENQQIQLPVNTVSLHGNATDEDGTIASVEWLEISGPNSGKIDNPNSTITTVNGLIEGIYIFKLTATDDKGATADDTISVTVNAAESIAPTVSAGSNQTITLPTNYITLTGEAIDEDGTIEKYSWTTISGPTSDSIENPFSWSTNVSNLSEGSYQFELTVTDNNGDVAKDTVEITVNPAKNIAPVADAGINQTITLPVNSSILNGKGTDEDGTISTYEWRQISGPGNATFDNKNNAVATVTGLLQGIYQFELKVTDDKNTSASDTVLIQVNTAHNLAPIAMAGNDQTIKLPVKNVSLVGSGKDGDGTIAGYAWKKIYGSASGSILNPYSANTDVDGLEEGIYQFELTVTDDKGYIGKDTVVITVKAANNIPPTADAGNNKTITLPTNSVELSGSGVDTDGSIASYQWTKISGPSSGAINNANSASATANNLIEGTYQFELKVTDNKGAIAKDTMQLKVNEAANIAPTANAGSDKSITLPTNSVVLSGNGVDTDGSIASYQWTKISGPNSGSINNANSSSATVNNLVEGVYQFELKVTDNKGAIAKDTMHVKVSEAANVPPTANAGNDKTITLPTNSVALSGSGADTDGSIASYQWTKISGPNSGAINNANSASATVNNLIEGTYQFELKVTDNKGAIAKDTMQVKVSEAANVPPTAYAGNDKTITLPTNSVALSGSGADSDGTIASYNWVKISGPSDFSVNNSSSAFATATNLIQGAYEFELTVTDNKGAIGKDVVKVIVNKAANLPPSANADSDQSITLPTNSVKLSGSGEDSDGSIASYQWTKISGPNGGAINNANSSSATVTNLSEGVYQFELKVTDDEGASAKDTMKVEVKPKAVPPIITPPTASAGKDTTILFPMSTVILAGNATKGSAEITSYSWKQLSGPSESVINASDKPTVELGDLKEGTYEFEFQVMDKNGATAKDSVKVTVALGRLAPEEVNNTISVYPNPVQDITTADINTGRVNTNVLITVTDISGKTIYKKQVVSTTENVKEQINMSNLSQGLYIVTIFFDNVMRKSIKVVKL